MKTELKNYNGPCIYSIWVDENPDKIYIGKTINYKIRSKRHYNDLKAQRHGNSYLQRLFNKNKKFNICPLEFCDKNDLSNKEVFWINFFKTNIVGYNLSKGGENIPDKLLKWSDERKKEWSKRCSEKPIAKGYKKSKSWKEKMQASVEFRKQIGNLNIHLDKQCIVTDIKTGILVIYKNIKAAAVSNNLAYTYLTEKIKKGNGIVIVKHFKIELNG